MARVSLAGFRDPIKAPRYWLWSGVAVLLFIAFMVVTLGATSTRWFCASACHKAQDDTITAYNRSSHSNVSCLACHEPVNANPVDFMLKKAAALGELYLTVTNNFELPLNGDDSYAKEMPSSQCLQCHSKNRVVTPSPGIIIDHDVHAKNGVRCPECHNRVAHRENFDLTLTKDGKKNRRHQDWMKMEACFRCHGFGPDARAPGECSNCHPSDFKQIPATHRVVDWFPTGHAQAKLDDPGLCKICHFEKEYCTLCHGMDMPHSGEFKSKGHPAVVKKQYDKCVFCHQPDKTHFCDHCHHGTALSNAGKTVTYKPDVKWIDQHGPAVQIVGVGKCLEKCHQSSFCSDCHAANKVLPTSHKSKAWTWTPPPAMATHAVDASANIDTCAICHGQEGIKAKDCSACHKLTVPHTEEFKKFHAKTGKSQPKVCANCHRFKELCSNCHHDGALNNRPWLQVHASTVARIGASGCVDKCHRKSDCVSCHTTNKVLPTSHRGKFWLHRPSLTKPSGHGAAFKTDADQCTYCHGTKGTQATLCKNCHKLTMPHPSGFTDTHKSQFRAKKLTKTTCNNCHVQYFCDKCHHNAKPAPAWRQQHPSVVKKNGPDACFKCHSEVYCSYCHVKIGAPAP
jgi:hypothetical protein